MKTTQFHLICLLIFALVFSFLSLQKSHAAPTKQLSYQGRLNNASGQPVANGTYSIVFSIYNVSSGGSALWTETQNVNVESGGFSAYLGSVTALTLPFNEDYYLGIKVGSDPEMTPRLKLAIVGTSAFALDAGKLEGKTSSDFALSTHTHTVTVGTAEITDGSIGASDIDATAVQKRVSGTCAGQVLVAINQDGTVTCEADDTGSGGSSLTPAASVSSVGASAIVGTSTNYAREDHAHDIPAGLITNKEISASAAIVKSKLDLSGSILFSDIAQNGCASGQVVEWNGTAWNCGTDDVGGGGGVITNPTSTQTIIAGNATTTPLVLKGAPTPSVPLFEIQDSAGVQKFAVAPDGHVLIQAPNILHVKNINNDSPSGPMGDITIDVLNNTANSKLTISNFDATYTASLAVEGSVLVGNPATTTAKVSAEETGTNSGGIFAINNASNASTALAGTTTGTGSAGVFQINNASSSSVAVYGSTTGTGSIFGGNAIGTGNLLQLQQGGADKFVVNNSGLITTPSVDSTSIANGTIAFADVAGNGCGSGQVFEYNGSAWICGTDDTGAASQWTSTGTDIYYNSGNVGIGTTTPAVKLHVYTASTDGSLLNLQNTSAGGNTWQFVSGGSFNAIGAGALGVYDINGAVYRLVINGSGNVGIGTVNPSSLLHLNGSIPKLTIQTTGTNPPNIQFLDSAATVKGTIGYQALSDYVFLAYGGGASMVIDPAQNIGIGTTAPAARLDVQQTGTGAVVLGNTTGSGNLLQLKQGGVDKFVVDNTGAITVGGAANAVKTNPSANQTILSGGAAVTPLIVKAASAPTVDIFDVQNNAGTSFMKISSSGNVGIGATNPASKLQVIGGNEAINFNTGTDNAVLTLESGDPATVTGKIVRLVMAGNTNNFNSMAQIVSGHETDGNSSPSYLSFWTRNNEGGPNYSAERMKITGAGSVGIGISSPTAKLHLSDTANQSIILGNTTGTGNLLQLQQGGIDKFIVSNTGNITTVNGGTNMVPLTDGITQQLILKGNNCEGLATDGFVTVTFTPAFAATPIVTFAQTGGTAPTPAAKITSTTAGSFTVSGFETGGTPECVNWIAIGDK